MIDLISEKVEENGEVTFTWSNLSYGSIYPITGIRCDDKHCPRCFHQHAMLLTSVLKRGDRVLVQIEHDRERQIALLTFSEFQMRMGMFYFGFEERSTSRFFFKNGQPKQIYELFLRLASIRCLAVINTGEPAFGKRETSFGFELSRLRNGRGCRQ